jgi:DUF4097 and DUF4098 domain-containing protein YvlB
MEKLTFSKLSKTDLKRFLRIQEKAYIQIKIANSNMKCNRCW